jgi:hypothetical protein
MEAKLNPIYAEAFRKLHKSAWKQFNKAIKSKKFKKAMRSGSKARQIGG